LAIGTGGCFKCSKETFRIFKRGQQLISVGEKYVFAVRLKCVEFERDVIEGLKGGAIKFVDISRSIRVWLQNGGSGVVIALRQKFIDHARIDRSDMEWRGPDEKYFAISYKTRQSFLPMVMKVEK
jgi:hypothetical protein